MTPTSTATPTEAESLSAQRALEDLALEAAQRDADELEEQHRRFETEEGRLPT